MWYTVIRSKYREEEGEWRTRGVEGAFGVGVWKIIRRDWKIVGRGMTFVVGNGRRVRFWLDRWWWYEPLREVFHSLFAIVDSKEAWVVEVWEGATGEGCWPPRFLRSLNDWEVKETFFLELHERRLICEEDKVVWIGAKDSRFSMKRLYSGMEQRRLEAFPSKVIWNLDPNKGEDFCLGGCLE